MPEWHADFLSVNLTGFSQLKYFNDAFLFPAFALVAVTVLSGCATSPDWLSSDGPSRQSVLVNRDSHHIEGIQLVDVNDGVARKLLATHKKNLFSETFNGAANNGYVVGAGDVIEVSVWEAPPAMLFGGAVVDPRGGPSTTHVTVFPEQMVSSNGMITIPFAGQLPSEGKTPEQIGAQLVEALKGKANQPQVLVRVIKNNTANVTVIGEVATSTRMPLTARGERLLDALATAGGVRQSVSKISLQLTRGAQMQALPLNTIISDPKQNIVLQPGDVITALYQSQTFSVLGAVGKNQEIDFEAQGISLAQALARAGGLDDSRADARAVFVFRLEDAKALDWVTHPQTTPDGKVPVIYQLNMKDPASFFVAQSFPVNNKDVIFVSNAPAADLQKFLNIVVSVIYPIVNVGTLKF